MEDEQAKKLLDIAIKHLRSQREDYEGAIDLVSEFSKKNFIPPDSLLEECYLCGSAGLYSLAYILAKTSSRFSPGDTKATAYYNAGVAAAFLGKLEEAESQYTLTLEIDPINPTTHYNYGNLLKQMGRAEEAEEHYLLAMELEQKNPAIHSNYGILLSELERWEEAENQYKLALESDPDNADAHFNYGLLFIDMGMPEKAEKQYKLALTANPDHVATHYNYGLFLLDMGMPEKAAEHYSLALAVDPKNIITLLSYGNLLSEMGKKEGAEKQYKLALKAGPENSETHYSYGLHLFEMGRSKEAEEQYKLALETDPKNVKVHFNYGFLLKQMGRMEEAEIHYKLALGTDPKYTRAHSSYGLLLLETGRLEEAGAQFKAAIELEPKNPDIHAINSLLLFSRNLEKESVGEMKVATNLFREKGDTVKENLSLAWLYEDFANKYYNLKDYRKFGGFAEASGDKYIEAGKLAGDKLKEISSTRGYLLKGKVRILKLNFRPPCNPETLINILNGIYDASKFYKNAAKASSEGDQTSSACLVSMSCLSEVLLYMLTVIKQEKVTELKGEVENWKKELASCEKIYRGNEKSEKLLQSLNKLIVRIENYNKSKEFVILKEERELREYVRELSEIARNLEGPVEKINQDSAEKMEIYKFKTISYTGTGTKLIASSTEILTSTELKSATPIESKTDQKITDYKHRSGTDELYTPESNKSSGILNWIYNP